MNEDEANQINDIISLPNVIENNDIQNPPLGFKSFSFCSIMGSKQQESLLSSGN
jgi:hypothetical protein